MSSHQESRRSDAPDTSIHLSGVLLFDIMKAGVKCDFPGMKAPPVAPRGRFLIEQVGPRSAGAASRQAPDPLPRPADTPRVAASSEGGSVEPRLRDPVRPRIVQPGTCRQLQPYLLPRDTDPCDEVPRTLSEGLQAVQPFDLQRFM